MCHTLTELGLRRAEADFGIFYTHIGEDIILLMIYIDDYLLTGKNIAVLTWLKQKIISSLILDLSVGYSASK